VRRKKKYRAISEFRHCYPGGRGFGEGCKGNRKDGDSFWGDAGRAGSFFLGNSVQRKILVSRGNKKKNMLEHMACETKQGSNVKPAIL